MKKIEIYSDRKQSIKLLIGSLIFVIGGIFMILEPKSSAKYSLIYLNVLGIITILFFSLGIYVAICQLIQNKLLLKIDSDGLTFNLNFKSQKFIKWKNIVGFSIIKIYNQKIVLVKVNNSDFFIDNEENKFIKKLMKSNTNKYGTPFNFSANPIKYTPEYLISLLNKSLKESKIS